MGIVEVTGAPLGALDTSQVNGVLVNDHVGELFGLEFCVAQIGAGGLKGIEHEGGGYVVKDAGAEHLDDLHESDLDGVRVFEQGKAQVAVAGFALGSEVALILNALMKKTVRLAPQRGRTALNAVNFYVLTSGNIIESHFFFTLARLWH